MNESHHASQRGQSLVEFAGVFLVLILLVLIIFDLGRAVYYFSAVTNAAREAARYGIVKPDDITGMQTAAYNYAVATGLQDLGTVTVCWVNYDVNDPYNYQYYPPPTLKVTVTYRFTPVTPLVSRIIPGGQIDITRTSNMKLEQLPKVNHHCP